jgi:hypothetical protein
MMRSAMNKHLSTFVVAVVTAAVTASAPAVAATLADYAKNADKVDGRHAVGAHAASGERAGRLVATNAQGRLPNDIIGTAPNAERVDGLEGEDLATKGIFDIVASPSGWLPFRSDAPLDIVRYPDFTRVTRGDNGFSSLTMPMQVPVKANGVALRLKSVTICYSDFTDQRIDFLRASVYRHTGSWGPSHVASVEDPTHRRDAACRTLKFGTDDWDPAPILQSGDTLTASIGITFDTTTREAELGAVTATLEQIQPGRP